MRYNLNPRGLLALLPLTADPKSNRVILTGLHFEANGRGVATSGHVMGVYRDAIQVQSGGDALTAFTLWGKWSAIRSACTKAIDKRGQAYAPAVLEIPDLTGERAPATLTVFTRKGNLLFAVEVSPQSVTTYPSWQQVIPRPKSRGAVGVIRFNTELLALFGASATLAFTTPDRATLVRTEDPDFLGVLMPLRAQAFDNGDAEPDWVRDIHGPLAHHTECAV